MSASQVERLRETYRAFEQGQLERITEFLAFPTYEQALEAAGE
jgi:hypothetical protein